MAKSAMSLRQFLIPKISQTINREIFRVDVYILLDPEQKSFCLDEMNLK